MPIKPKTSETLPKNCPKLGNYPTPPQQASHVVLQDRLRAGAHHAAAFRFGVDQVRRRSLASRGCRACGACVKSRVRISTINSRILVSMPLFRLAERLQNLQEIHSMRWCYPGFDSRFHQILILEDLNLNKPESNS